MPHETRTVAFRLASQRCHSLFGLLRAIDAVGVRCDSTVVTHHRKERAGHIGFEFETRTPFDVLQYRGLFPRKAIRPIVRSASKTSHT